MRHKNQTNEFIKECICYSYITLLYEKPKEEISITEICEKSGFGRTTYYRHFSSNKNDLIFYISKQKWIEYKQEHLEAVEKDAGLEFLTHLYNHKRFMLMLKEQNMIELLFIILSDIFGTKDLEDKSKKYSADIFVGMCFAVIYDWICFDCIDEPEEIKKRIQGSIKQVANEVKKYS